jgi:hypothetical protein
MANYPVTNFNDLVSAINNASDGDTIIFNNTGDLVLSGPLPAITKSLTFTSPGRNTTISGNGQYRVFTVNGGNVTLSNLTVAKGLATDGGTSATGLNGASGVGGGLLINGGSVTLINTVFQNNTAQGGAGQASGTGVGGNGGDGLGGAVYVSSGFLRISNSSFSNNAALAGSGGAGLKGNGQAGNRQGGAIYVSTNGTVLAEGAPRADSTNTPTDKPAISGPGSYYIVDPPPLALSINRTDPDPTAAATVNYQVQFNKDVSGVDATDFTVKTTGSITGAGVVSVTPVNNSTYTVAVNAGVGNGTIELDLVDDDSIRIPAGIPSSPDATVPLGGTGLGNGNLPGQSYTVNRTPPTATITYANDAPSLTAANTVTYTVFFSEPISGLNTNPQSGFSNFAIVQGSGISGASIQSVTPLSVDPNNLFYNVVVNTGNGNGTVGLRLKDSSVKSRSRGVALSGNVDAPVYTVLKTPPTVASITQVDNPLTGNATVSFNVTFTQAVKGLSASDFAITGGLQGTSIVAITPTGTPTASGATSTYLVAVNTGSGDGSLGLNVVDNDTILNDLGVPLGGAGAGNGSFSGPTYSIIKSAPLVSSISLLNANPTASGTVSFLVTFNQDVAGVTLDAFRPAGYNSGLSNFSLTQLTGSGSKYIVTATTGVGSGILGLNFVDNDAIVNGLGLPVAGKGIGNGNFSGPVYMINRQPPRVTAINRLQTSSTNAATVNFTVSFDQAVSNVDSSDFQLATQGLPAASISSVTRINDSFYSVAVNTGPGEGAVGLNLIDNDSIINTLGVPLGGVGANNGNFQGEAYRIDRTPPVASIIDITPNSRRRPVRAVTIQFTEAVTGFDVSDLQLTRNGRLVSLSKAALSTDDGITWRLSNLKKLTSPEGKYRLTVVAAGSGITDAAGNPLLNSVGQRWKNPVSVPVPDSTSTTRSVSRSVRSMNSNDALTGLGRTEHLVGGKRLISGSGSDTLIGGTGTDRFIYSGADQASALANSLVNAPDRIENFNFFDSDKFQLNYQSDSSNINRPTGLFNAGTVIGQTLEQATRNAYRDKDQVRLEAQKLSGNEAVFFNWHGGTYIAVNDSHAGFSAARDLVANVSGIQLKPGDANAGSLNVANYFA